jgi:hypothetical protein
MPSDRDKSLCAALKRPLGCRLADTAGSQRAQGDLLRVEFHCASDESILFR